MGLFDSPSHIIIVLVVLVLLFGSAKLPKLAKSLGESMRIFKKEAQKLHDDADGAPIQGTVQQQVTAPPPAPAQHVQDSTAAAPAPTPAPVPDAQRTNQPG